MKSGEPIPPRSWRDWLADGLAVAAMLVIALAAPWIAAPSLVRPRIEPPPIATQANAGKPAPWQAAFPDAMRFYAMRDYTRTIERLRPVVQQWPSAAAPRFYLGVCRLLAG